MKSGRAVAAAILMLACAASGVAQIPVLAPVSRLEDLKGKIVLIRGFSSGPILRYDPSGTVLEAGVPESWTLAGVRIEDVHRRGDLLEIRGARMALLWEGSDIVLVERKLRQGRKPTPENVNILVKLPRADDAAAIELAQRIFVTDIKQLNDLVPNYWRGLAEIGGSDKPKVATTTSATPGSGEHAQVTTEARTNYRVGVGVSAPRTIFAPDPPYVEAARVAKIQGTTVLWTLVGSDGSVRDVRIARPIGFGLDDSAAETVKQWQFRPSMKDGQPVSVQVMIEVNFRLYN